MKTLSIAIRFFLFMTILTGIVYPTSMTILSQALFHRQAQGSFFKNSQGTLIGSELIAQKFTSDKYFWPRPSAVDYNPMPSGATNLGPTSQDLVKQVKERKQKGFTLEMLFSSGSGLDPHISPQAARDQIARVAKARGKSENEIKQVVNKIVEKRQFGIFGEERINVLKLNQELDEK